MVLLCESVCSQPLSFSAGSYWSLQTSCCSAIKETHKRQERPFPRVPGARQGKGGRKETCCSDICWLQVHTNKDNLRMPGSGVVTRMCGGVFWECLKAREEQQHVRAEQPLTHVWLSAKSCCGPHIYLHLVKDLEVLTKSAQTPTQRDAPVRHNIRNACLTISTFTLTHLTGLKAWLVIQITSRIGLLHQHNRNTMQLQKSQMWVKAVAHSKGDHAKINAGVCLHQNFFSFCKVSRFSTEWL